MKIIVSGYIGKNITGIGRNIINLLENERSGNEYIFYTNYDLADNIKFANNKITVKKYNISKSSSLKNLLWTTFVFPLIVLKEHGNRALIPNFTLLIFRFVPTVVIIHDLIEFNVPEKFSKLKMFYRKKLADPITAKRSNKIITVSENSKKDIVKFLHVDIDKITVIYNGIDRKLFNRKSDYESKKIIRGRYNVDGHYILNVGTVDYPGKNIHSLIMAYEGLRKDGLYNGKLVIIGMPGKGYDVIESMVNESIWSKDIFLLGHISDDDLVCFYSNCDIFSFLSFYEGFGIPPLEAMACGARVLVSNCSSLPEVVGELGYKVDPSDIEAIKKEIVRVLNSEFDVSVYSQKVDEFLLRFDWEKLSYQFSKAVTAD